MNRNHNLVLQNNNSGGYEEEPQSTDDEELVVARLVVNDDDLAGATSSAVLPREQQKVGVTCGCWGRLERRRRWRNGRLGIPNDTPKMATVLSANHHRPEEEDPYAYNLISEGLPCVCNDDDPEEWRNNNKTCQSIIDALNWHSVRYCHPTTGQTVLHQAAFQRSCVLVLQAIVEWHPNLLYKVDASCHNHRVPLRWFVHGTKRYSTNDEYIQALNILLPPIASSSLDNTSGDRGGGGEWETILHAACSASEDTVPDCVIERLVARFPNALSRVDSHGRTPLHCHCRRRRASVQVARWLFAPNNYRPDSDSLTPLHCGAQLANAPLISFLVSMEKDPPLLMTTHDMRRNPLHILCQTLPSEINDRYHAALHCLTDSASVMAQDATGSTPLHLLLNHPRRPANLQMVQSLVEAHPACLKLANHDRCLPLHCAVRHADFDVVAYLIHVYPDAARALTRKNDTALSLASDRNASAPVVELLLSVYPQATNMRNDYGYLPLHCVCRSHPPLASIVNALIQCFPASIDETTNAGESPLHLANNASREVLELLTNDSTLEESSCCVNKIGNTPLHVACFRNASVESIEALARSHPDWITAVNVAGYSPLQLLCRNGRCDSHLVQQFFEWRGLEIFSLVDQVGHTPLHSAMRLGTSLEGVESLLSAYPPAVRMLTNYHDTPLHLALLRQLDASVISTVIRATCADPLPGMHPLLQRNCAGQTPFSIAFENYAAKIPTAEDVDNDDATTVIVHQLIQTFEYGVDHGGCHPILGPSLLLHRHGVRVPTSFFLRVLNDFPDEIRRLDNRGNYPLHLEAAVSPTELEGYSSTGGRNGHNIFVKVLDAYPEAVRHTNQDGETVLSLLLASSRSFNVVRVIGLYPQALHGLGLFPRLTTPVLAKVGRHCGVSCLFQLIRSRPDVLWER